MLKCGTQKNGAPEGTPVSLIRLVIIPPGLFFACGLIRVEGERTRPGTLRFFQIFTWK